MSRKFQNNLTLTLMSPKALWALVSLTLTHTRMSQRFGDIWVGVTLSRKFRDIRVRVRVGVAVPGSQKVRKTLFGPQTFIIGPTPAKLAFPGRSRPPETGSGARLADLEKEMSKCARRRRNMGCIVHIAWAGQFSSLIGLGFVVPGRTASNLAPFERPRK